MASLSNHSFLTNTSLRQAQAERFEVEINGVSIWNWNNTVLGGHDWTDVLKPLAASVDAKSTILRMVDYTEQQRLDNFPNDHQGVDACI